MCIKIFRDFAVTLEHHTMLESMLLSVESMGNNTHLSISASKMFLFHEWLKGTGKGLYPGSAGPLTQLPASVLCHTIK